MAGSLLGRHFCCFIPRASRPTMDTAEDLRREVWRLLQEAQGFTDPKVKQELAARAFVLAQRAEILERDGSRDNRGQQARSAAHPVRLRLNKTLGCRVPVRLPGGGAPTSLPPPHARQPDPLRDPEWQRSAEGGSAFRGWFPGPHAGANSAPVAASTPASARPPFPVPYLSPVFSGLTWVLCQPVWNHPWPAEGAIRPMRAAPSLACAFPRCTPGSTRIAARTGGPGRRPVCAGSSTMPSLLKGQAQSACGLIMMEAGMSWPIMNGRSSCDWNRQEPLSRSTHRASKSACPARRNPWAKLTELRTIIADDCPRMRAVSVYDRCGVHYPPSLSPPWHVAAPERRGGARFEVIRRLPEAAGGYVIMVKKPWRV